MADRRQACPQRVGNCGTSGCVEDALNQAAMVFQPQFGCLLYIWECGAYEYIYIYTYVYIHTYVYNVYRCSHVHKQQTTAQQQTGFPSGIIHDNWNDPEKTSVAPAQGWHAQIEKCKHFSPAAGCWPKQYKRYLLPAKAPPSLFWDTNEAHKQCSLLDTIFFVVWASSNITILHYINKHYMPADT